MIDLTNEQNSILNSIVDWIENEAEPIAILQGSAGTGKTTILKSVVHELEAIRKTYLLLAPTGRAARILGKKTSRSAKTIHSEIYELGDIKTDEHTDSIQDELDSPGFAIPFRLKDGAESKVAVYIVDESSMVSDQTTYSEILSFGSGRLLHDLLHYARIINCNNVKSKILFVGDSAQLPPIKCSDSPALNQQYFLSSFKTRSKLFQLDKVMRQAEGSVILANAEKIRKCISSMNFTSFNIHEDGKSVLKVNATQAVKNHTLERDTGNSVIITVSNRDALNYNMAIRRQRFGASDAPVQCGDILLVCRNSAKNKYFNGDLLVVVDVEPDTECRSINIRGGDKTIDIYFRNVLVRSVDDEGNESNKQCKIIENLLHKPSPILSMLENRALIIDFRNRHPDIEVNSDEFKTKLISDEYFNALMVKFGYAITCHKAQGGEWANVYVNFSGFPNRTSDFYRWAYTAITRSRKTLGIIDAPSFGELNPQDRDIEPPDDAECGDSAQVSISERDSGEGGNEGIVVSNLPNKRGARWTSEEEGQLISEFNKNKTIKEISKSHGRSRSSIRSRLLQLGIISPLSDSNNDSNTPTIQEGLLGLQVPSDSNIGVTQRRGAWKKIELDKVYALWGLSDKNHYSVNGISLETGRTPLAIIIQLYKAEIISMDNGNILCIQCKCKYDLSTAMRLY